jgi:gluconolactonase
MVFAKGLSTPEGPVLLPDRSWLVCEMGSDRGCVTHLSSDGQTKRVVASTGRPNGLAVDKDGVIWVAESLQPPSLLRVTMDGETEVFLTECDGEPFLFPNDLAFGPDGALYMTDSGILFEDIVPGGNVRDDFMEMETDGRVYRIDLKTRLVQKIDSGIRFTNGIAFGPDHNLYVSETLTGMVYRYPWVDGRIVGSRNEFGNTVDPDGPKGIRGPDGMKFGADGNLYVAVYGQRTVSVLGHDGAVVTRIPTEGSCPSNLAFGPADERKIYVTEDEFGTLEAIDVETDGLPLCY